MHGGNVRLKAGAADADLDLVGLTGGGVGGIQLPLDGSDQGAHLHAVAAAGDAEFIAAVARQHAVIVGAHLFQNARQQHQCGIALQVAVLVVDVLEVIHVHHEEVQRAVGVAAVIGQLAFQIAQRHDTVADAGQGVHRELGLQHQHIHAHQPKRNAAAQQPAPGQPALQQKACRRRKREQQQGFQFLFGCFLLPVAQRPAAAEKGCCQIGKPHQLRPPEQGAAPQPFCIQIAKAVFVPRCQQHQQKQCHRCGAECQPAAVLHPCTPQLCLHIQKHQQAATRRQQIKQNAAPGVQPVGQGDAQILPRAQLRQRTAIIYDRQRPGKPQQRRKLPPGQTFIPHFLLRPQQDHQCDQTEPTDLSMRNRIHAATLSFTLGRLCAVRPFSALPTFLFRTNPLYQIHNKYATQTEKFVQKKTPERLSAFRCLLKNYFACGWVASLRRALSRIFSSVCSLRMCSALQASSAAVCSSTPSCTKKWVSSWWRL